MMNQTNLQYGQTIVEFFVMMKEQDFLEFSDYFQDFEIFKKTIEASIPQVLGLFNELNINPRIRKII